MAIIHLHSRIVPARPGPGLKFDRDAIRRFGVGA